MRSWVDARGRSAGPLVLSMPRDAQRGGRRLTGRDLHRFVVRIGRRVGIKNARPHALRHAAITTALDLGADIRSVRQFGRHADIRTTMIYDDARRDLGGSVARLLCAAVSIDAQASVAPNAIAKHQSHDEHAFDDEVKTAPPQPTTTRTHRAEGADALPAAAARTLIAPPIGMRSPPDAVAASPREPRVTLSPTIALTQRGRGPVRSRVSSSAGRGPACARTSVRQGRGRRGGPRT